MWAEIVREYTEKGTYAQTDLRTKFLESKCPFGGDIWQFLDELRAKRDELSAVGVKIEEKDYHSTIIQSLPNHLASFASGQLATARLYATTKTIDPDILISLIIEESERRTTKFTLCGITRSCDADAAMSVMPSSARHGPCRGRGFRRGSGNARPRPPCWNCGSHEHFKAQCPVPDRNPGRPSTHGTANVALSADLDSDDEGAFALGAVSDDEDLPDLLSLSSDDDNTDRMSFVTADEDWFSEIADDDLGDTVDGELAALAGDTNPAGTRTVKLYDSGSTRHISPYRECFETLIEIPPKSFAATNK